MNNKIRTLLYELRKNAAEHLKKEIDEALLTDFEESQYLEDLCEYWKCSPINELNVKVSAVHILHPGEEASARFKQTKSDERAQLEIKIPAKTAKQEAEEIIVYYLLHLNLYVSADDDHTKYRVRNVLERTAKTLVALRKDVSNECLNHRTDTNLDDD